MSKYVIVDEKTIIAPCGCNDGLFMVDCTDGIAEIVVVCGKPEHWRPNRQYLDINGGRCTAILSEAERVAIDYNSMPK